MESNTYPIFGENYQDSYPECFPMGSQPMLPCGSSTGSLASASTPSPIKGPFTPPSGRSTPGLMTIDHESGAVSCFGDFEYAFQNDPIHIDAHNVEHHQFATQIISPPHEFPQAPYQYESAHFQMGPSWSWPGEQSQLNLFEKQPPPTVGMPPSATAALAMPRVEDHYLPSGYMPPHQRRSYYANKIQETTAALQRVQGRSRVAKRANKKMTVDLLRDSELVGRLHEVELVQKGAFKCDWDKCGSFFKRLEHMKRHFNTVHMKTDRVWCPFCWHMFNRIDNSRGHCKTHATEETEGKGKRRTDFVEKWGPWLYKKLENAIKQRKPKKNNLPVLEPNEEVPGFIGPKLPNMMTINMLTDAQKIMLNIPRHEWTAPAPA
ncbi:hypothetical protein F5Y10DRAFT_265137 [Nemania abortiva]|nr:hypothetical protein F5Y10DRAFT_265137 [Nemania abortiva]